MSFTFHSAHSADWPAVLDSSVETEAEVSRDVARWATWTEDNEDRCQISRDFQCTKTERDKIMTKEKTKKTQNDAFLSFPIAFNFFSISVFCAFSVQPWAACSKSERCHRSSALECLLWPVYRYICVYLLLNICRSVDFNPKCKKVTWKLMRAMNKHVHPIVYILPHFVQNTKGTLA